MTKRNDKSITVAICHHDPKVIDEVHYEIAGPSNLRFIESPVPSGLRFVARPHSTLKVLVIDQKVEPRESENIWEETALMTPETLVVVIARSGRDRKRIHGTAHRIVLGPNATGQQIATAIRQLRVTRGQEARQAHIEGVIWVDPSICRVRVHDRDVPMSLEEFHMLMYLAADPYETVTKVELAQRLLNGVKTPSGSNIREIEKTARKLKRTLADAHLDAVIDQVGLGYQLLPSIQQKHRPAPVMLKAAA